MSEMKVFELARELGIPAKDLVQKIELLGIRVTGHFNVLSENQLSSIREQLSNPSASPTPKSGKKRIRRSASSSDAPVVEAEEVRKPTRRIRKRKLEESSETPTLENNEIAVENDVVQSAEVPTADRSETVSSTEKKDVLAQESQVVATSVIDKPSLEQKSLITEKEKPLSPVMTESEVLTQKEDVDIESEQTTSESKKNKKNKKSKKHRDDFTKEEEVYRSKKRIYFDAKMDDDAETIRIKKRKSNRKNKSKDSKNTTEEVNLEQKHTFNPRKKSIKIGTRITVGELASAIGIKVSEIIKKLFMMGTPATINQSIPGDIAELIAAEFDVEVVVETFNLEDVLQEEVIDESQKSSRSPIVTVMGHVDHGKTSLLDAIRKTHVTKKEAGGITQHIGAYHVQTEVGSITFLDTPGHEAFTAMRSRGADITDIVILVVAADDGVQPQTVEAINHAKAAGVPILVAINKIDKPDANSTRIRQELLSYELVSEDLGGDTIFAEVSAKTGTGLDNLLELLQLQAEILELKSTTEGKARGVIIESQMSSTKGAVGTVLIQQGTLNVGDIFVVGSASGKVRAMYNEWGENLQEAHPAIPVEILGFQDVPETGETFIVLEDEKVARQIAQTRANKQKEEFAAKKQKLHLENLFQQIKSTEEQIELNLILKADVQGSLEALEGSMSQIKSTKISLRIVHSAPGNITEADITLASVSNAIIIGFNTKMDAKARQTVAQEGVDVRLYNVIYDIVEDVKKALTGMLQPEIREEVTGHCEVRAIYNPSKGNNVIGGYVTDGKLVRSSFARILRDGEVVHSGKIISLRRFKDDVKEVFNNYECGLSVNCKDIREGDIIEGYVEVEEIATL